MNTETQETLKAESGNGYLGTFWDADWYKRRLHEEYLGGGERRRFCTAPVDNTCLVAVRTSGTAAPPPDPDPGFVNALNEILEDQNESDIIDFFTSGLGFDNFQFLDDIDPSYLAGLQGGSKTIIRGNPDSIEPEHLYLVVDYGITMKILT